MDFIILRISRCYNSPPEVNSRTVLSQLLEQYHAIIKIFRGLKVRCADLDQNCSLFNQDPCLKSTNEVIGSLLTMYSVLDLAQKSYEEFEILGQSVMKNSAHYLASEPTSEIVNELSGFLAEAEGYVKTTKGLLLSRVQDLEVLKRELELLRAKM